MGIVSDLAALSDEARKKVVNRAHVVYDEYSNSWEVLADAYDGSGGFLDGGYLWRFPREDDSKFAQRQEQARYHNYTETLVELFTRYLTRGVDRVTDSDELRDWWDNVDGTGTRIEDYMRDVVSIGLASSHVGILMDKPDTGDEGETRANDTDPPFLTTYPPLTIQDWIVDARTGLAAIKLREKVPASGFEDTDESTRYLVWDDEEWARFDTDGAVLDEPMPHHLGRVPLEVFRPKRHKRHPFIGKPLVSDQLVRAIYNRASEEDEVLRTQAFSQLIVSVPTDADAETIRKAQDLVSEGGGTTKALIVAGTATYATPDMSTAEAIRSNQAFLIREIYRMAHVVFRSDSKDAESAEAIRLQHQELNEMLTGMAQDLVTLEQNISRLFFLWTSPSEEAAESAYEAARVSITYPDEFFERELALELESWALAVSFGLGPTAEKAVKRRVIGKLLANEDDETRELIDEEIEAGAGQSSGSSPAEQLREAAAARLSQFVEEEPAA